jgi:hypothetical protein
VERIPHGRDDSQEFTILNYIAQQSYNKFIVTGHAMQAKLGTELKRLNSNVLLRNNPVHPYAYTKRKVSTHIAADVKYNIMLLRRQ